LDEEWSNGLWVNKRIFTLTHDANGKTLSVLDEEWSNGQWVNLNRDTYIYDVNGRETSYLYEHWSNGQWVNYYRGTLTYDANGNMLSGLYEEWSNGQWVNSSRYTCTYDANGNMLSELYEQWSNGQWVNLLRHTYTYDALGNLTSFSQHTWRNASWTPYDMVFGLADSAGNSYVVYGYSITVMRKLITTGIAPETGNVPATYSLSQNYPNPFNTTTVVGYQLPVASDVKLVVFDLLGREVSVLVNERRETGVHEVKFDGSGLSSGVYFYQLHGGDFVQTRRFLLVR
jgi:hypothetical protein